MMKVMMMMMMIMITYLLNLSKLNEQTFYKVAPQARN